MKEDDICFYANLYRLLREDEDPKRDGLMAQDPFAKASVHDHVSYGSTSRSQYISTSATWNAVATFAFHKKAFPKLIAKINVKKLQRIGGVSFVDLTKEENRTNYLLDSRASNFARKFEEVLIVGKIPPSCIDNILSL